MSKTACYILECRSNLHAGGGNESSGTADKGVQRDVSTGFPIIHGSGLKGALREKYGEGAQQSSIFGSSPKEKDPQKKSRAGNYNFYDGWLLSYPVRSNVRPCFNGVSAELLQDFLEHCDDFECQLNPNFRDALNTLVALAPSETPIVFGQPDFGANIILEDWEAENRQDALSPEALLSLNDTLGKNVALLPHRLLKDITGQLPSLARNYLENGLSANLWYEEVTPRATRFYTFIEKKKGKEDFTPSGLIQVGGNATVGQGQVKFTNIQNIRYA